MPFPGGDPVETGSVCGITSVVQGNLAVLGWITGKPWRIRKLLQKIAPQGNFHALRAQGTASAFGLRAMTCQGGATVHQCPSVVELSCTGRSLSAATFSLAQWPCAASAAMGQTGRIAQRTMQLLLTEPAKVEITDFQ